MPHLGCAGPLATEQDWSPGASTQSMRSADEMWGFAPAPPSDLWSSSGGDLPDSGYFSAVSTGRVNRKVVPAGLLSAWISPP